MRFLLVRVYVCLGGGLCRGRAVARETRSTSSEPGSPEGGSGGKAGGAVAAPYKTPLGPVSWFGPRGTPGAAPTDPERPRRFIRAFSNSRASFRSCGKSARHKKQRGGGGE